jgi:hypothetical protein
MQEELDLIREQAQKIERSGALGDRAPIRGCSEFLVACSMKGRTPKELEIAMEVFGKSAGLRSEPRLHGPRLPRN